MTNSERLKKELKKHNISNFKTFNVILKRKLNKEGKDPYEEAQKDYNNFMKKIDNETRHFNYEEIAAIEEILNCRFVDLIKDTKTKMNDFIPDGLRYIAYRNDYNETKNFALRTSDNQDYPIFNYDEFGKSLFDYIEEYNSDNCLEYLIKERQLKFEDPYQFNIDGRRGIAAWHDTNGEIARMIIKKDNFKYFNQVFCTDRNRYRNHFSNRESIFDNDDIIELIYESDNILQGLLNPVKIDVAYYLDEPNTSASFLFNKLLTKALAANKLNKDKILMIIEKGIKINNLIVNELIDIDESLKIENDGSILEMGSFVCFGAYYNYELLDYVDGIIKKKIEELNNSLKRLIHKPTRFAFDEPMNFVKDNKEYIKTSNNKYEYEMLRYMNEVEFRGIPKLYEVNSNGYDIVEFFDNSGNSKYYNTNNISAIGEYLYEFHKKCEQKLGNGKVYLHNNLCSKNVVFERDMVKAIIDWSNCSIGDKTDDIVDVIALWSGISESYLRTEQIIQNIDNFFKSYPCETKIHLGDRLLKLNKKNIKQQEESNNVDLDQLILFKKINVVIEALLDKLNEY